MIGTTKLRRFFNERPAGLAAQQLAIEHARSPQRAAGPIFNLARDIQVPRIGDSPQIYGITEDFIQAAGGTLPGPWATQDTSTGGTPTLAYVNSQNGRMGGFFRMKLDTTTEVEAITLYHNDVLLFDLNDHLIFEWLVYITPDVTGAGGALGAGDKIVFGLGSARNATLDSMSLNAWFMLKGGSAHWFLETDDNVTNTDDVDTEVHFDTYQDATNGGITQYGQLLSIDLTDLSNVRFLINNVDVVPKGTTMSMAGITTPVFYVQPFIEVQKASAANKDHCVDVDLFRGSGLRFH